MLVARDTRPSGPSLEDAVAAGVTGAGGHCRRAGVLPSGGLAAAIAAGVGDVGVMITASHNQADDNGFKLLGAGGKKLDDATSAEVERWLASDGVGGTGGSDTDATVAAREAYARAFARSIDPSGLAGRRIAVDLAHGAAITTPAWFSRSFPALDIRWCHAGDGVINDDVGSQHPDALARVVRDGGFDAGIAVDGDADRCVLVDDTGAVVDGDSLSWLLATGLGVDSLAVTVMSNAALEGSLPGVAVTRTPVGDRHLAIAMAEHGIPLGCEESGHVLFHDALPGGDGLLTGLRAAALCWGRGATISSVRAAFTPFPRRLSKVRVKARPPLDAVPELVAATQRGEARLEGGRVFLRYSGTEPVLRILVEGADDAIVADVAAHVTRVATEVLG